MRKRAQRKSKPTQKEPTIATQQSSRLKKFRFKKSWWIPISLIAIFLLVLFLNSYFNVTSGSPFNPDGTGFEQYYLSGPDPYYNMRIVNQTLYGDNPGQYPFYSAEDPLLNYPLGRSGGRPPFLNMMAIGFGTLLTPFMSEIDAVGIAMQFIPALFGALLIFPIYFIGKTLFGKKEGLLAALLIALIPIHLGSGHGSAYALFDHDSFNLLLFFITYFFVVKAIKETDTQKSILYAIMGGIPLAALSMTWVEHEFLYTVIAVYIVVQMIIDIFTTKIDIRVPRSGFITLFTGYLISLPVLITRGGFQLDIPLSLCIGIGIFGLIYILLKRNNIPWTLSLPSLFILAAATVGFLFFIPTLAESFPVLSPLTRFSSILQGTGIYGNKVSLTIAEAGTYGISQTVMSFGPALFWVAWIGFIFIGYHYLKHNNRRDLLFFLVLFLIQIWFIGIAGRFMNDLVPFVALFSAWLILYLIRKFDYKAMIKNIKSAGSGWRGIRKGVSFLHIFGILFVAFIVLFPNAYLSLDAAVPGKDKQEVFGDLPAGAFPGGGVGKEIYWVNAFSWLADQDTEIPHPKDRPGFISWWDYGFYEVAVGEHPTVADNFQDGIPPAANFHISTSEKQAVSIWIIRLLEGNVKENRGKLSNSVVTSLETYLEDNDSTDLVNWLENPEQSPSYGSPIAAQYSPNISEKYPVGQQWPMNAVYHDGTEILTTLSDENITRLYRDVQDTTGKSIRYYGVEGYDEQIFNIFAFLADKSLLLVASREDANPEDAFDQIKYVTQNGQELTYEQVKTRSDQENRNDPIVNTRTVHKDAYYNTTFYRVYIGPRQNQRVNQFPCYNMKHFYADFISPIAYPGTQRSSVVIAKYYEGAYINGTITCLNASLQFVQTTVFDNYGVPHNTEITDENGTFSLLSGAGNIILQLAYRTQQDNLVLDEITFNQSSGSVFAPISDEEAMRTGDYYRNIGEITIDPSTISGYVYKDENNNGSYDPSVDTPLSDITVYVRDEFGVYQSAPSLVYPSSVTTDENGYYEIADILPSKYNLTVLDENDFLIYAESHIIDPGNHSINVSKPVEGNAEGTVYFDENQNDQMDSGEEMSGVTVDLLYITTGTNKLVDTLITGSDGTYAFTDLVPGDYQLNLTKLPDYETKQNIVINENSTTQTNISMQYAKITVTGTTKNQDTLNPVANMSITFSPDTGVVNNTAVRQTTKSDTNGAYRIDLMPGTYNVTVMQTVEEDNVNVTYSYSEQLILSIGQGSASYDILLAKEQE